MNTDTPLFPLYRRAEAPIAARVEDLLARMTLDEKLVELCAIWDQKGALMGPDRQPDAARLAEAFPLGVGHVSRPADSKGEGVNSAVDGCDAAATAERVNAFQRHAQQTRLGIPVLCHEEGLHGYAAQGATSFPQAIALASSFDPDLVRAVNAVTAREMRARGAVVALTPVLDIARDPRWGRIEETFGEDPHLVAELGIAAVRGLQGTGETLGPDKVFATLKHLAGHGQPEGGVNVGPAPLAERELREQFLPPFERAVKEAGACIVMASYNEIDGLPSHANPWLLQHVLRGEWGFEGAVIGDYFAVEQLASLHHVAADAAEAAARALASGVDADLPNGAAYRHLAEAVRAGRVPMAQVDTAVRRMLTLKFRAGLFEQPGVDAAQAAARTHDAAAVALALQAAERCAVLLKNDGVLPLRVPAAGAAGAKPIWAVIGPNAAVPRLGAYSGEPPSSVSLLQGLQQLVGERVDLRHAQGVRITEGDDWWADAVHATPLAANLALIDEALAVAAQASVVVLAVGDDERTSREAWATHHLGDRSALGLVGEQGLLFERLHALGKPVVVVLINGRPISEVGIAERANAIVEAWFPGEQGGLALARVLTGAVNPGGKLPLTVPRHVGQLPAFYNHKPSARRGYLFEDITPLWPFGHGLSYTRFEFGPPRLSALTMVPDGEVEVSVDLRNVGERDGDEVVQLYVRDRVASVAQPVKALKGFRRVSLAAGETRTVRFTLSAEYLALWNAQMQRVVEPGEFDVMVGPSSAQLAGVVLTVVAG